MKERNCKIVQDLLPNHIEKLTNEETNKYIEEHLKECKDCQKVYENMKKEIQLSENKKDNREVKYIKKYKNKMKILKSIILAILAVYVIIITRRMIILSSIAKKAEEMHFEKNNYYVKAYNYPSKGNLLISEWYYKDGDYLITTIRKDEDSSVKNIFYKKGEDELQLIESNGKRSACIDKGKLIVAGFSPEAGVGGKFIKNLIDAHCITIKTGYCNGKDCYIINMINMPDNRDIYVDKETGGIVRYVWKPTKEYKDMYSISDCEYKSGVVKDSDIVKPELYGNEEYFTMNE